MDEFLLVCLGEKTFNSVDVSELVKSCLGDSSTPFCELFERSVQKLSNLEMSSFQVFTACDRPTGAQEVHQLLPVFIQVFQNGAALQAGILLQQLWTLLRLCLKLLEMFF